MHVKELLDQIPDETLDFLASQTRADYKVKKLSGRVFFKLFLSSLLRENRNSLRVMEQIFGSYQFQHMAGLEPGSSIAHSSISERFNSINPAFFEALFKDCVQRFSKYFEQDDQLLLFDSTHVSVSAKLIDVGLKINQAKGDKRQLKFTMGISSIPVHGKLFTQQKYASENLALSEAIREASQSKERIVVFDRGLQSRPVLEGFTEEQIWFVTRLNSNARFEVVEEFELTPPDQQEQLVIERDVHVRLFDQEKRPTKSFLRLVIARSPIDGQQFRFLTNMQDLEPQRIAQIYKKRWDIEVFFKFLKQHLNFSHLTARSLNGITVTLYATMILAILLTVYKQENNMKGYKIPKLRFSLQLDELLIKQAGIVYAGMPNPPI